MLYIIGAKSAVEEMITGEMSAYSNFNGVGSVETNQPYDKTGEKLPVQTAYCKCDINEYLESQPVNIMQIANKTFKTIYVDGILDDIKNRELKFTKNVDLDRNPSEMIYLAYCLSIYRDMQFKISQETLDYCICNSDGDWIRPFMMDWNYYSHSFLEVLQAFNIIPDYDETNKKVIYTNRYYPAAMFALPSDQFRLLGCEEFEYLNFTANVINDYNTRHYTEGKHVYELCQRLENVSLKEHELSYMLDILPEYSVMINQILDYMSKCDYNTVNEIDSGIIEYIEDYKIPNYWYLI